MGVYLIHYKDFSSLNSQGNIFFDFYLVTNCNFQPIPKDRKSWSNETLAERWLTMVKKSDIIINMEQLRIKIQPNIQITSCAFTGHRELPQDFPIQKLKSTIEETILKGADTFYNGMAVGFDLLAAEILLSLKDKYPYVKLVACIPCYHQEKNFSDTDKKRYANILRQADEQILLSEKYYRGCMQVRDQYMSDNAEALIAYCKKDTGGAAYTVKYFQKKYPEKPTFFIWKIKSVKKSRAERSFACQNLLDVVQ